ncbi:MAG TPA: hypothetical protein PKC28_11880 [Bdellovibrionales bacterium]|nr:hypothetical protein [Bdellovibrionales bacterium]
MKVVSVLIFAIALIGSWSLIHAKKKVSESVHVGIQSDLKNIITEYVGQNLPAAKNLRFEKMWTETLSKDKVRANFVYSFEDNAENGEPAIVEISGSAMLKKIEETPEMSTWNFDELRILDNKVNFTEAIHITAGAGELESQSPPSGETY